MELYAHGRWIERCECGCGAAFDGASGEIVRDGALLVVACNAPQLPTIAALDVAKREAAQRERERQRAELRRGKQR